MDEFAGGSPSWQGTVDEGYQELNHEQLYDRWHRHTKHCPNCRESMNLIEKVRRVCTISTGLFALLALAFILIGLPLQLVLISTLMSILSLSVSYTSDDLRQRFVSSLPKRGVPWVKLY